MGLTTAPVSAWPLAWIALAPLWILVVEESKKLEVKSAPNSGVETLHATPLLLKRILGQDRQKKEKEGKFFLLPFAFYLLPLLWGIGYHGVALSWITGIHPMTWMGVPWLTSLAIAIFCWSFITLWGAALVAAWAACMSILVPRQEPGNKRGTGVLARVLIGVALWCGLESLWSLGPLWWSSLSYTQSPHNLAILHLGQISGPTAVTAAIVAVNGLVAEAWIASQKEKVKSTPNSGVETLHATSLLLKRILGQDRQKKENFLFYLLPFAFCLILHVIGFGLYSRPLIQPPAAALKVGIIQGNVPNEIKLYPGGWRRAIEGYTNGYRALAEQGVDAVLTPEGALPFRWNEETQMASSFYAAVKEKGVVAWLGAFGEQERGYSNSLLTITGKGKVFSRYDKSKLVPLGEYVPFEEFIGGLVSRLSPLDEHQIPGSPNQVFDTPFGRAIAGICYESAFSEHFRRQAAAGGQFILSASNDAHYSKAMPAQHHAQDIMRAVETDRWAVRATNTGYSAIVDPHGRTRWISGINTYEIHADTIYRRQTQTLYVRWGDWLTPVLLVGGGLAWLLQKRD